MTIDRIISLISTVALVYFAYGTWRIDSRLANIERALCGDKKPEDHECDFRPTGQWSDKGVGAEGKCRCGKTTNLPC